MKLRPLSRRSVLMGLGGMTLALPPLEAMLRPGRTHAATDEIPRRILIMFTPNGVPQQDDNKPDGTGTKFTLKDTISPLESVKDKINFITGLRFKTRELNSGMNPHQLGMTHCLVARKAIKGAKDDPNGPLYDTGSAGGISLDQEIAKHIAGSTKFSSLALGVNSDGYNDRYVLNRMGWREDRTPVHPIDNAKNAFDRVFGGFAAPDDTAGKTKLAQDQLVVDAVLESYKRLNTKLSGGDKIRLEAHMDGIYEMQRQMQSSNQMSRSCVLPTSPGNVNDSDHLATGQAMMSLIQSAFSCDLNRVCTLQWSTSQGGPNFNWIKINDKLAPGGNNSHHGLSHLDANKALELQFLREIYKWYCARYAELITSFDAVQELDGKSLLDHSLIYWVNELGEGDRHQHNNLPFYLAGGAGGTVQMGRHLNYKDLSHSDLHVSVMQALGIKTTTFGDPKFCNGPLPGLVS